MCRYMFYMHHCAGTFSSSFWFCCFSGKQVRRRRSTRRRSQVRKNSNFTSKLLLSRVVQRAVSRSCDSTAKLYFTIQVCFAPQVSLCVHCPLHMQNIWCPLLPLLLSKRACAIALSSRHQQHCKVCHSTIRGSAQIPRRKGRKK